MKPTSPLSLLLFLQFTTGTRAAPIPLHLDCLHYASCDTSLRDLLSASLGQKYHNPPPTTLSNPHFPSHQLDYSSPRPSPQHPALPPSLAQDDEELFNNAPVTPPSTVSPNTALTAKVPLESSYLQAVAQKQAPSSTLNSLAAKPTSALPSLRKEDLKRYRDAMARSIKKTAARLQMEPKITMHGHVEQMSALKCTHMDIQRIEEGRGAWKASQAREYSDLLVVAIVVLFLCAVVAVEAVEKIGDLRHAIFGSRNRQGPIRLEDDTLFIVKKPFYLQPAPPPKWKIRSLQKGTLQRPVTVYAEDDDTDVESFKYDSDAKEEA